MAAIFLDLNELNADRLEIEIIFSQGNPPVHVPSVSNEYVCLVLNV